MPNSLKEYREWCRQRLDILTPLDAGVPISLPDGTTRDPQPGDQPPWQPEPSNEKLNSFILTSCDIVNQQANVTVDVSIRSLTVPGQTANGPLGVDLAAVPGYPQRSIIGVRRAWWNDGTNANPLGATFLSTLDRENNQYANNPPNVPLQFAIEGNTLFLIPAPAQSGTLQFMCSTGLMKPSSDVDTFQGIPEAYDSALLYIAIVEYGKSSRDTEMKQKAQAFTSDASAGLERVSSLLNGGNSPEAQASLIFDATPMRRNSWRR